MIERIPTSATWPLVILWLALPLGNAPGAGPNVKGPNMADNERKIIIDPEFRDLIPPSSAEERRRLEDEIKRDGCRDALILWKGHDLLLGGHHRYAYCIQNNISYHVV